MKIWQCLAGRFQGYETDTCYDLRGIRYATSERFCEPVLYHYPDGLHSCLEKAPYAVQLPSKTEEFLFGVDYDKVKQEESCQYLSITIPKKETDNKRFPVMVWIHGGAFRNGGCDHDCYDSDLLASEGNVIVIRLNYRLGVLGYVKDKTGSTANLGLLDVITALQWVQENIEYFGGDKENVTLFGQSAGAQTIAGILVADGTDQLFKNIIMQSTPLGAMTGRADMDKQILDELNKMPDDADISEVCRTQRVILSHVTEKGNPKFMPFAPHYGVKPLPQEERIDEILKERASRHALLIGCNSREAAAYIGGNKMITKLDRFPITRPIVEAAMKKKAKAIFIEPSMSFAARYAAAGGQCWYYNFSWGLNKSVLGACHCMELIPLFGGKGLEGLPVMMSQTEHDVISAGKPLREIWTDFAKIGSVSQSKIEGMLTVFKKQ